MVLFQILDCSTTLGTCCSDYGLVKILDIFKTFLDIIQIVVPILLIVSATIQLIQMIANPDDKKGMKKLLNKFMAAVICFLLPLMIDVVMGLMNTLPSNPQFQLSACWESAKISKEILDNQSSKFVSIDDNNGKTLFSIANSGLPSSSSITQNRQSSAMGREIVEYASSYVGNDYCWGGKDPNVCADCSGFVSYVYKHFGINLISQTNSMWSQTNMYTLVHPSDIRAGDVVMYNGHVGILTGRGNEIIHAKGTRYGIVIDPDYTSCSNHAIRGIMRINGVN